MEDSGLDSLSSFIRLTGVSVPARARFIGEAIASSTLSGLAMGLCCGQIGAMMGSVGPLVPFLCGTWVSLSRFLQWKMLFFTISVDGLTG